MKLLALDTSTSVLTAAVCGDARLLAETYVDCGRAHSERLMATVDWLLNQASLTLRDLDGLAVAVGPGSFTGLRIGVSAMKGLAFAMELPLVPVSTLDALAQGSAIANGMVCPLLDARMKEVYAAVYRFEQGRREKTLDDRVAPIDAVLDELGEGPVLFVGDGAALYGDRIRERMPAARFGPLAVGPRASAVAVEALAKLSMGGTNPAADVSPVYLRKSQAELARENQTAFTGS